MSAVLVNENADQSSLSDSDSGLVSGLKELFGSGRVGHLAPYFYMNGGSDKFRAILETNQDYRPFSDEASLIQDNLQFISDWAEGIERVVIIGPGPNISVSAKEIPILASMQDLKEVVVYEISPAFNQESMAVISTALPHVQVSGHVVDYRNAEVDPLERATLVISTGSLTNFEDCPLTSFPSNRVKEHVATLKRFAGDHGKILWGYNSQTDATMYNSEVNHDFIMYLLHKACNDRFRNTIKLDPSKFVHVTAKHNGSILAHSWVATATQLVQIDGSRYPVRKDESFHPFISVAIDPVRLASLVQERSLGVSSAQFFQSGKGAIIHCLNCN